MTRQLIAGAGIRRLDPAHPDDDANAVIVQGDQIVWIGASSNAPDVDERIDVDGWLSPSFVDAHVHATATGLAVEGLSLASVRSLSAALDALAAYVRRSPLDPVLGGQWEETEWPEGRPPCAAELSAAAPGRRVLLERVDGHSCVVDARTLAELDLSALAAVDPAHVVRDEDGRPTGWLKEHAGEQARKAIQGGLSPARLERARQAACRKALSLGIGSFHEMGHPGFFGYDDAVAWADPSPGPWPVDVLVWWADMDRPAHPALRIGGDLFLDGSIGSGTAAVSREYADIGGRGNLFHEDDAVARLFLEAGKSGKPAAVHAIGDRAIEQAIAAIEAAAAALGRDNVRQCRHRIEHVELVRQDHVRRMAELGVVASMQPCFDAAWGGSDALYSRRFGAAAALETNPFSWFAEHNVAMAFGSDSTVTPMGPWAAVEAATQHRGGHRLDLVTSWSAHSLGGRYVAHQDEVGPLRVGHRADLAAWHADPLEIRDVPSLECVAMLVQGKLDTEIS